MYSKIIAGPSGFHAFCADSPIGIGQWETMEQHLGPKRETQDEAEQDVVIMLAASSKPTPMDISDNVNMFAGFRTSSLIALDRIAKSKRRGLRPWFSKVDIMIALRDEISRRTVDTDTS